MKSWGGEPICQDCIEEICPTFEPLENESQTTDAYNAVLKRYVGRSVINADEVDTEIEYDRDDPCIMGLRI